MFATGTKGLLLWCKQITSNYGEEIAVKNMTTSFKNGMAFCAILHHYRPDLIDFSKLSKENVAENNALAFRVAEDELDIPALLDVEDMVEMKVPDKLSIMTYVSQYYNYFKDKTPGEIEKKKYGTKKRTLTKDDKTEPVPTKKSNDPLKEASLKQKQSTCCLCNKKVFLMERLTVESKLFHRICFKCCVCDIQLKTSTYEYDRNKGLFYCSKDFKERNKGAVRQEPIGSDSSNSNTSSPLHKISEDAEMAEIPSIANNPFKRNEQFIRKGIRPQSSPADITWEKQKVVKSKHGEGKPEKSVSKSKISFPGLKKNKKKTEEKNVTKFSNPSYQQHLELSKYMHELDTQSQNERVVIGSESQTSHVENSGTLSGVAISPPKSPIQKFSGNVEQDSETSNAISGKSPKKKKLVLKVKKKFNKSKKNKDSVDGKDIEASGDEFGNNESNHNQYAEVEKYDPKRQSDVSVYENIDNFRDAEKSKATDNDSIIYDNNKLCKIIDDENEPEIYENETNKDIPSYEPKTINEPFEKHYAEPTKVLLVSDNPAHTATVESDPVESGYQEMRSKLRKVNEKESVNKNKDSESTTADSYLQARANLRRSCLDLSVDAGETAEKSFSPNEESYSETKKALHHTGLLENEINNERDRDKEHNQEESIANDDILRDEEERDQNLSNKTDFVVDEGLPSYNELENATTEAEHQEDSETAKQEEDESEQLRETTEQEKNESIKMKEKIFGDEVVSDENGMEIAEKDEFSEQEEHKGKPLKEAVEQKENEKTEIKETLSGDEVVNDENDTEIVERDELRTSKESLDELEKRSGASDTSVGESHQGLDKEESNDGEDRMETEEFDNKQDQEVATDQHENEAAPLVDQSSNDEDEDHGLPTINDIRVSQVDTEAKDDEGKMDVDHEHLKEVNPLSKDSQKEQEEEVEDGSYPSTIMVSMVTKEPTKKEASSNPFEDSDDEDKAVTEAKELNPFLTSSDDDDDGDSLDESNPFADDARAERKSMRVGKESALQRLAAERLSQKDRNRLKQIGVEESNPFAEDLLEESDNDSKITVPAVSSSISGKTSPSNKKKLVLKTKHGHKVKAPPPPPPTGSTSLASDSLISKPRPQKREAPKAPARPVSAPVIDSQSSLRRSFKKRAAPRPPQQTSAESDQLVTNEMSTPPKPPRREPGKQVIPPKGIEYANVQFEEGKVTVGSTIIKDDSSVETEERETENKHITQARTEENFTENINENVLDVEESVKVDKEIEEESKTNESVVSAADDSIDVEDDQVDSEEEEERDSLNELPSVCVDNTQPSRQLSEKRKAPTRPPPLQRMESLHDNKVESNIALRDKQPKRKEIELELKDIEIKQRELEREGVTMEKKLRECVDTEPEDAYLLTWFELVNQKNQLLRRENELIYMCQELDFLQNQRHAEFELRQLMMKAEHEKTESDRDREEELLAEILNLVTMRSNIVDRMDEDRLREYEEDEEVQNMMQEQGLSHKSPSDKEKKRETPPKVKKEKKKKEKETKKEKVKKKKK